MADIQVNVSYAGGDNSIAIISAKGFIDTTTAPELEKKLEEQLALNKYKIIVDLKNIDYVSSAGWGVFVSEIREIRENNGDLVLANMSPDVYDVYELMEFSSILKAFDSVEDAISHFTGKQPVEVKSTSSRVQASYSKPATIQDKRNRVETTSQTTAPSDVHKKEEPGSRESGIYSYANSELGRMIINVILDNPYYEVKEIARALKLPRYGGQKVSPRAVKQELKQMGLFDRQKRFEIALKGRG